MNIESIVGRFRALPNENRYEFLREFQGILDCWKLYNETMESIVTTHGATAGTLFREGAIHSIGRYVKTLFHNANISLPNKTLKMILKGNIQNNLQGIYYPCKIAHSQMAGSGLISRGSNLIQ